MFLGVAVRQLFGYQDFAGRQEDALGGLAGELYKFRRGHAVALVKRYVNAELIDVFGYHCRARVGTPADYGSGVLLADFCELGGHVLVVCAEALAAYHANAEIRSLAEKLFFAAFAKGVCNCDNADFPDISFLDMLIN